MRGKLRRTDEVRSKMRSAKCEVRIACTHAAACECASWPFEATVNNQFMNDLTELIRVPTTTQHLQLGAVAAAMCRLPRTAGVTSSETTDRQVHGYSRRHPCKAGDSRDPKAAWGLGQQSPNLTLPKRSPLRVDSRLLISVLL